MLNYIGINLDDILEYVLLGILGLLFLLFILLLVNIVQNRKLKKRYNAFMAGKDVQSLEDNLIQRINQIEELLASNQKNSRELGSVSGNLKLAFQKLGLVKYNAFQEMGGKLSFSLALLNKEDDGFIINAVHSREGCYTYIKEVIKGNSVLVLSEEEKNALDIAMGKQKRFEEGD
ncbi:hypothetical protein FACS1894111_09190 [Clostridia bacterium]|nr:hypothetical protein FACS1894111_09190 [Clostridia bacterium]